MEPNPKGCWAAFKSENGKSLRLQLAIRGQFLIKQRQETTGNHCTAQDHMTSQ